MNETPEAIVSAIAQGDTNAENLLLRKYYSRILFILTRKTRDEELALDLCQDTFRIVLERLRTRPLDEPEKLSAFLHSTASNLFIAEVRKTDRRQTYPDSELVVNMSDSQQDHYQRLLQERSAEVIRKLILTMENERDRKILYSYYIEEKEKQEVCDDLGLTLRHFDKVIYRAKKRFRELLEEQDEMSFEKVTT